MSEIEKQIIELIKEKTGVTEVTRTSTWEQLGVDSLDVAECLMEIEEKFSVTIPDSDASNMKSVGEIIDYVEKKKK
jgi:acyl carrier protein